MSLIKVNTQTSEEYLHYEAKSNGDHLLFANGTTHTTFSIFGLVLYSRIKNYTIDKLPEFPQTKKSLGY